jgi:GAF domain-containing protein
MCSAAIGNIISDVAGVMLGTFVEDLTQKYLSVPSPVLSDAQRKLRSVRWASQFGCAVGLVIGCIIGMFPLAFIDSKKNKEHGKRQAGMDAMCQEVVAEAGNLLHAERTSLFILCDKPEQENPSSNSSGVVPNPDGKYLHAKYSNRSRDLQQRRSSTPKTDTIVRHSSSEQPFIPLGRGIVSRTALTREACNIYDVSTEQDYISSHEGVTLHKADSVSGDEEQAPVKNMLCVPVLDGNDHTIGVLQAINKVGENEKDKEAAPVVANDRGFTAVDVQILKALASHITVSLQRMMLDTEDVDDEEKRRLRDTIRIIKGSGLTSEQTR